MKPELQYSILCDDVRQESNGKFIFLGAFNTITSPKFPVAHLVLHIANQWCVGEGEFRQQSRIVDPENKALVVSPEIKFMLKDYDASHIVISRFHNVQFSMAGKYSVEVLLDGELFRRFPFHVVSISKKPAA